jgi:multicomponent Na+:H+ antiporter subunit C
MIRFLIFACGAAVLIAIGLHGAITRRHLVRQILALNVMSGGVFLLLIAVGARNADPEPDPVPQALVLTGIVVAVSVSGLALAIARAIHARTGNTTLSEEELE